jgi:cell division protein FtsW (lipid II flippase)
MHSKAFDRFNIAVFICGFALIAIGLLAIYSATYANEQVQVIFPNSLSQPAL